MPGRDILQVEYMRRAYPVWELPRRPGRQRVRTPAVSMTEVYHSHQFPLYLDTGPATGIRGGAVSHMSRISSGVRP